MTKVKICGITNLQDALMSVKAGADFLGFNFYEKSPRFVLPEKTSKIVEWLPDNIMKVGVFVNETADRICEIATIASLDAVQLHGDEANKFIEEVHTISGLPVIRAVRITPEFSLDNVKHSSAEAVLLDKYSLKEYGGSGEVFDWSVAERISEIVERVYLAGGLTPENVGEAIRIVRPYAVDVASGVESLPGKKDPEKVAAFIAAVKKAL